MPIQNFAGWTATGALFMGLSRWLWRSDPPVISHALPLTVYALSLAFAIVLSAAGDVWVPIAVALGATLAAAALGWRTANARLRPEPAVRCWWRRAARLRRFGQ